MGVGNKKTQMSKWWISNIFFLCKKYTLYYDSDQVHKNAGTVKWILYLTQVTCLHFDISYSPVYISLCISKG